MQDNNFIHEEAPNVTSVESHHSEDPFNIYKLLQKKKNDVASISKESDPTYPPGFTPANATHKNCEDTASVNDQVKPISSNNFHSFRNIDILSGGSSLDVMDDLVKVGQTMGYNMDGCLGLKVKKGWINSLCSKHKINFVALQETKMESMDLFTIKALWGNFSFDHAVSYSVGNSGGILCVWDPNMFIKDHVSSSDYFLAIMGTWVPSSTKLLVILVYAPQELSEKRELWGLIDIPLGGYSHTWSHKSASKMSKLDRFLISEGLMAMNPTLSGLCLDRHLSDHHPIIMFKSILDYGPTPFRMFHSWFEMEGFDKFMEDSWHSMDVEDSNGLIRMKKKLQCLKSAMKTSVKDSKLKKNKAKSYVQDKLTEVDKHIDQVGAKVRWSTEGDENSKYFHGIINNKRSQLAIRGILIDGDWISDSKEVKAEFLNHFAKQFSKPSSHPVSIDGTFPNRLNLELKSWKVQYPKMKSKRLCGIMELINPRALMVLLLNSFKNIGMF
ncbi:RNA-directed DNA polymerase, eukaryota [Tanacetum coccineum]